MRTQWMILLCLIPLLAACGSATPATAIPEPNQKPDRNVTISATPPIGIPPSPLPPPEEVRPRPEDATMRRENVYLEKTDLLVMESYPPQFALLISGNLPTPCNQLRVQVNPPDEQKRIAIEVYSVVAPDAICIEVLKPFRQTIPLGSFPAGHYTILVNGKKVAEFDAGG